ncbi:MAG TPA: N,N-dimethylformamidase beta subunit family domain-containing protein [Thermoanaerobaculia bacterium]|jgi:hypothetical protein
MFRPLLCCVLITFALDAHAAKRRAAPHPEPPFNAAHTQGGYANATSVRQGDVLTFHIATSVSPFTLSFVNLARPDVVLHTVSNLTSAPQNCSGRWRIGCDWNATTTIRIPGDWPSGYYAASFPTAGGTRNVFFVVRAAQPGRTSPILVIAATHTYQAYNRFGGESLYFDANGKRGSNVSFDRPYDTNAGLGRYPIWESHFVNWMQREGRAFEVATDSDLEDPTLLNNYRVLVLVGHSEYWTATARAHVEQFSRSGGHIAVFGGNTMWWQVRLNAAERTLVGYKQEAAFDPLRNANPVLTTTHFWGDPVNNPEDFLFGASFRHGGYANIIDEVTFEMLPLEQRTGWSVTDPAHWIYANTSVSRGTEFGKETVGLEVDGALFQCDTSGQVAGPDPSAGTPSNFHILATTPGTDGYGTLGIYTNQFGGAVFNAATQGWVYGLAGNSIVQTMTRNVLERFVSGPLPYDAVAASVLTQETFNCPKLTGWEGTDARGTLSARCASEGPAGLELSGAQLISISRNFSPNGVLRKEASVRLQIKADQFVKRTEFGTMIVALRHRTSTVFAQPVWLELDVQNGQRLIRIARRDSANNFSASTWLPLPDGFQQVDLVWRSPGAITLTLANGQTVSLDNADPNQVVSQVVIGYPEAEVAGNGMVCVDALSVR